MNRLITAVGIIVVALRLTMFPCLAQEAGASGKVKVAAVQISGYDKGELPRVGYEPQNRLVPYIERAAKDDAQLVVFPEYVLGHISVPGEATQAIGNAAKKHGIYVIVGCWEMLANDSYANTALLFGRDGQIAGRYCKTHAAVDSFDGTPAWSNPPRDKDASWFVKNDPEWMMQRGQDLPVFKLDFGTIGILTCYDGWFPESFRVLSLKGADFLIWINGRGGNVEDFITKSVMFQSHVAMICTNQAYGGGTMIGDIPTRILKRCPDREESYIVAELNLDRVRTVRSSSRNFSQRRPDLYVPLTEGADLIQPTAAETALRRSE